MATWIRLVDGISGEAVRVVVVAEVGVAAAAVAAAVVLADVTSVVSPESPRPSPTGASPAAERESEGVGARARLCSQPIISFD